MNAERLLARESNVICPGYDAHKPRTLRDGEEFALTDSGDVVCFECEAFWSLTPVPGYEGRYSITPRGMVWSYPKHNHRAGMWLRQCVRSDGYAYVSLHSNGKVKIRSIHRLVAETFIPNHSALPQVNHKNSEKLDNRVENLEWCTLSHNSRHSWASGTSFVTEIGRKSRRKNMAVANAVRLKRARYVIQED